jgi:hypothetical protein
MLLRLVQGQHPTTAALSEPLQGQTRHQVLRAPGLAQVLLLQLLLLSLGRVQKAHPHAAAGG